MTKVKNKTPTCGNCIHLCYREHTMYRRKVYCCTSCDNGTKMFVSSNRPSKPTDCVDHKFKNNNYNKTNG